ncbi:MAG: Uncharacterized protein G01um10145_793 [Microgenomates group bacterium Gr01-1014_5]|nr:MAG: Uncharacterized protein G01um10145_793 [Microgenomates group bacterium Gr01-1014_5]
MSYVIIDESGRFADASSKVIVFSALVTESLVGLDKIVFQARRKLPTKKKEHTLPEIKFSKTGENTKRHLLQSITKRDIDIFSLVVFTEGRKILDTPQNYALLVSVLLGLVVKSGIKISHIIIDRHFTWTRQREQFDNLLQQGLETDLFIEHLDSQQNAIISLPDFVAGATRERYIKELTMLRDLFEAKIVKELKTSWRELKQQKR